MSNEGANANAVPLDSVVLAVIDSFKARAAVGRSKYREVPKVKLTPPKGEFLTLVLNGIAEKI
jgi:hypothetical protein